jgi:hypothetical protein
MVACYEEYQSRTIKQGRMAEQKSGNWVLTSGEVWGTARRERSKVRDPREAESRTLIVAHQSRCDKYLGKEGLRWPSTFYSFRREDCD